MKKLFVLSLFFSLAAGLSAQIGLSASWRGNDAENWKLVNVLSGDEVDLLGSGPAFGVDYWFRLKEVRLEFLPELNFARYQQTTEVTGPVETKANFFSLFLNTNIYFLDFFSDCDCPTWSKQSRLLARGLFLQLSPGITRLEQSINFREQAQDASAWSLSLGAALGYDIGFSDLITVTPMVGIRYFMETHWEGLSDIQAGIQEWEVTSEDSSLLQYYAGIRVGLRFND